MKKQIKEFLKKVIKLKGFRHISYLFVEIGFTVSRFFLTIFNGARHHQENPWRRSNLLLYLNKKVVTEETGIWKRYCLFLREHLQTYQYQPKISILLPVYRPQVNFLSEAIKSVLLQSYQNWQLCIVDDASQSLEIEALIKQFLAEEPDRIAFRKHDSNKHISATTNSCFSLATGEYIVLLDHDDRLKPNALAEVIRWIVLHGFPDILYSDEETINEDGRLLGVVYKPGWSEFLHLSKNYTTHLSAFNREFVKTLGGWREGLEGAQDHDLMLRAVEATKRPIIHIPLSLYQWRAHDNSTARQGDAKPYAATAGAASIEQACLRRGFSADVQFEVKYFQYRVAPVLPDPLPLISIIIPNKDSFTYLEACLKSIYSITGYRNFEVIVVDNGSSDQRCFALYRQYAEDYPGRFSQISDQRYFNYARLNNLGVEKARGEYVVLLNNDTEVLHSDWLEGLLQLAQLEKVGSVGCKLFYGNGPIQHAGIYGAGRYIGGHSARLLTDDDALPLALNHCIHECLAVTAACLMIAKDKYLRVGGLDEQQVPNGFGDVLFGMTLRQNGLVNLYTPYVRLKHHESITRSKNIEMYERAYLCDRFAKELLIDEYYHLSFQYNDHYMVDEITSLPELTKNWVDMDFYGALRRESVVAQTKSS